MPAASGTQTLLDRLFGDPNAGGARGFPFGLVPTGAPGRSPVMTPMQSSMNPGGGAAFEDMRGQRGGGGIPGIPEGYYDPETQLPTAGLQPLPQSLQDFRHQRVSSGMPKAYEEGWANITVADRSQPILDPKNWFLTHADIESPLQYMAGGPFISGDWVPNMKGGYFTLDQLSGAGRVPALFSGPGGPSTNNPNLAAPYGGQILRSGSPIGRSAAAQYGLPGGRDVSFSDTAESGAPGSMRRVAPGTGAQWGYPSVWQSMLYWPGGPVHGFERWPQSNV